MSPAYKEQSDCMTELSLFMYLDVFILCAICLCICICPAREVLKNLKVNLKLESKTKGG